MAHSETPNRIQDAATQLFAERGFDGVSGRDIANRADVTVGSINYYFNSKEELYRQCCRALAEAYAEEAQRKLATEGPRAALEHFSDFTMQHPQMLKTWLDLQGSGDPDIRAYSETEVTPYLHRTIVEAFARMGDMSFERQLRLICFAGAVMLRGVLTDEWIERRTGKTPEETRRAWNDVLFGRLIED